MRFAAESPEWASRVPRASSAAARRAGSTVRSCRTTSEPSTENTPIASPVPRPCSTRSRAASCAATRPCVDSRSNTRAMAAWPEGASAAVGVASSPRPSAERTIWPAAPLASGDGRTAGTNWSTRWGTPSSSTSKSAAVRSVTGRPCRSCTTTSTVTRADSTGNCGGVSWVAGRPTGAPRRATSVRRAAVLRTGSPPQAGRCVGNDSETSRSGASARHARRSSDPATVRATRPVWTASPTLLGRPAWHVFGSEPRCRGPWPALDSCAGQRPSTARDKA